MSEDKLRFWRIALYSSASAGLNILGITISTWLLYFYAPTPNSGRLIFIPAAKLWILLLPVLPYSFGYTLANPMGVRTAFLETALLFLLGLVYSKNIVLVIHWKILERTLIWSDLLEENLP